MQTQMQMQMRPVIAFLSGKSAATSNVLIGQGVGQK